LLGNSELNAAPRITSQFSERQIGGPQIGERMTAWIFGRLPSPLANDVKRKSNG
jgi:hypothetical protein